MKPYKGYSPSERMAGQRIIDKAVEEGRYPKAEKCSACGQTEGVLDYHADDYASETILEHTRILCYPCHITHHILHNNPDNEGAKLYEKAVAEGRMLKPFETRNFNRLMQVFKWLKEREQI